VRTSDIKDLFGKYGKIMGINIRETRDKFAFVEFSTVEEAAKALKA